MTKIKKLIRVFKFVDNIIYNIIYNMIYRYIDIYNNTPVSYGTTIKEERRKIKRLCLYIMSIHTYKYIYIYTILYYTINIMQKTFMSIHYVYTLCLYTMSIHYVYKKRGCTN